MAAADLKETMETAGLKETAETADLAEIAETAYVRTADLKAIAAAVLKAVTAGGAG